jgi:hypothetical protein
MLQAYCAIILGEMVQTNQKIVFYAVFGHFGAILAIWVTSNGLKKIHKGP